jgi:hypothetical protein
MRVFLLAIVMAFIFISCNDKKRSVSSVKNVSSKQDSSDIFKKGTDVIPEFSEVDSIQIIYYDDPYGDPKRYSRFYSYVSTENSEVISTILSNFKKEFSLSSEVTKCHSEGKIYLFNRAEDIKTIYFSSRPDTCSFLYFIKDGMFFKFELDDTVRNTLALEKKYAIKPLNK